MSVTISCPRCGHTILAECSLAVPKGPCAACGQSMPSGGTPVQERAEPRPVFLGLSVSGLVLVCLCVGSVVAMLIPALNSAIESARLNSCTCNGKNLALSL